MDAGGGLGFGEKSLFASFIALSRCRRWPAFASSASATALRAPFGDGDAASHSHRDDETRDTHLAIGSVLRNSPPRRETAMASAPPDFDAVMERALAVGVLTTPAYDRLTDEIARGDRTELLIAEEWAQARPGGG